MGQTALGCRPCGCPQLLDLHQVHRAPDSGQRAAWMNRSGQTCFLRSICHVSSSCEPTSMHVLISALPSRHFQI